MQREWKIDGPNHPAREMKTYIDIATAIGILQEQSADIKAASSSPYDNIHAMGVDQVVPKQQQPKNQHQGPISCSYCHVVGNHERDICPQQAADWRKDDVKIKARHERTGQLCSLCQQP